MAGALFSETPYPAHQWPIDVIYFDNGMQVVGTETLSAPGVMLKRQFDAPTGVQLDFADGSHEVTPAPPVHVWDAVQAGDTSAYAEWFATLCPHTDPVEGGGRCYQRLGHDEPCEYKLLNRDRFGRWEVRTISFTPDWLTDLLLDEEVSHMTDALQMWTVYEHPLDYPGWYVARLSFNGVATNQVMLARALEGIRAQIPQDLVRFDRHPLDDPVIVETWF